jgi:hypothetical protein
MTRQHGGRFLAHMKRMRRIVLLALLAALGGLLPSIAWSRQGPIRIASVNLSQASTDQHKTTAGHRSLSREARLAFIRRAQVWAPTIIPSMDIRTGPVGSGAFLPNELVDCDYTDTNMHGATRKFHCKLATGDIVKVRYGASNGEVQGSVLATRLLWALGFAADRVYPVRVACRGCTSDPWTNHGNRKQVHDFDPAVIEQKPDGYEMWNSGDAREWGWDWDEMDRVDPGLGGAPVEQRDALKLLAVFMQHTDTKSSQQRLLCASKATATGQCDKPFLMLHDVGITFGRANNRNRNSVGSVNLQEWINQPVWKDPAACVGNLDKSMTGTLGDPVISEAGRKFLADLLVQLTDQQLRDLFEVAGVDRRVTSDGAAVGARVDDWVAAFNAKRQQIVMHHCPR